MKQKAIFIGSAVLLILAFVVGAMYFNNLKSQETAKVAAQNQKALIRADAPSFGPADAPVHVVEFLDPACGTCQQFYPMVKNIMDANPDKIRLTVRYAPFHPGSDQVVKVLEAAKRQGKFEPTLEALFASQALWVQNHTAQVDLIWGPLAGVGLDMDRLKYDMNLPEVAQIIARDLDDAKALNVTQTPEYFVNGLPLPSFGFDQLKTLIDNALANAPKK